MRTCLLLCASLLLALPSGAHAQISPGPLARAHHKLEGPTHCTECHGLRREAMEKQCLACHRGVAWLLAHGQGYHARVVTQEKKKCGSCHPDHAGIDFKLIAWPNGSRARFDHAQAGWPLEGKHAEAKCEDCHTLKFRVAPAAALSPRKGSAGWLGLETACVSCHRVDDVHKGSLSENCARCHNSKAWKPAPKFDHDSSAFPLTGKHVDVACNKCHLAPRLGIKPDAKGRLIPRFKPLSFKRCSDCHADPHRGKMSARCADCHTTRGWKIINQRTFDHNATRFPLVGKHRGLSCDACHGANLKIKDPPFSRCRSCHTDPHRGKALVNGKPADCSACHRVQGFTPSTFTVAMHAATPYPLTGKHRTVKCGACHKTVRKHVNLTPSFGQCTDCHTNAHGAQLASLPDKGACESCHSNAGWKPSTFSLAAHAKAGFPLDGRHAKIACDACHGLVRHGLPKLPKRAAYYGTAHVVLQVPETACRDCHVDPHKGRFRKGGAFPVANGCAACHDATAFRPSTVDVAMHARFSFALDGAHRAVPCVECHEEMKGRPASSTLILAPKGVTPLLFDRHRATTCRSCHAADNPHGNQFASLPGGGACASCHDVNSFTPASKFNHDRDTSFPLQGAHAKVPCTSCHKTETVVKGQRRVVYKGLSTRCASCHSGTVPKGGNGS